MLLILLLLLITIRLLIVCNNKYNFALATINDFLLSIYVAYIIVVLINITIVIINNIIVVVLVVDGRNRMWSRNCYHKS